MILNQPLGIAAIPNNLFLGVRYIPCEDGVTREAVYTGDFLILFADSDSVLHAKVLEYGAMLVNDFILMNNKPDTDLLVRREDNPEWDIVDRITKERIEKWIEYGEYFEDRFPVHNVLDAIYSHVHKNLYIDDEAKAYLETLKKKINYKNGK